MSGLEEATTNVCDLIAYCKFVATLEHPATMKKATLAIFRATAYSDDGKPLGFIDLHLESLN